MNLCCLTIGIYFSDNNYFFFCTGFSNMRFLSIFNICVFGKDKV